MDESTKFKRLRKNRNFLVGMLIAGIAVCLFLGIYLLTDSTGRIFNLTLFYEYLKLFLNKFITEQEYQNMLKVIAVGFVAIAALSGLSITFLLARRYIEFGGYFFSIISSILYIGLGVLLFFVFPATVVPVLLLVFGLIILISSCYGIHLKRVSLFFFNTSKYTIPDVSDSLTIYFSDRGSSKKIAYEMAARNGTEIYELVPVAFSSAGVNQDKFYKKYSKKSHAMSFDIQNAKNFEIYKKIIIVSPMSFNKLCPPVRYFFREYGRKISPDLELYLVGGLNRNLEKISNEVKALTELPDFKLYKMNVIFGNKTKPKLFKKV